MGNASSSTRANGRRQAGWLVGGVVGVAMVVAASVLAFGTRTASARQSNCNGCPIFYTAMYHMEFESDDSPWQVEVFDGWDSNGELPLSLIALSAASLPGPTGTHVTAVTFETFRTTHLNGFSEYHLSADGKTAKLMGRVTAPAGVNGATVSPHKSSAGDSQVVTWSKDGVTVGSPVSVNAAYYIDFAAKQAKACASGLVSPPIAMQPTLVNNTDGTTSAGRTVLMPCKFAVARTIKITK